MISLIALALAASTDPTTAWANCIVKYALPRLKNEPSAMIVDGGMAVCFREDNAARDAMILKNGRVGSEMWKGVKYQARDHLIIMVDAAKRQRGYK